MISPSSLCFHSKSTPILGRYEDTRGIRVSISACLVVSETCPTCRRNCSQNLESRNHEAVTGAALKLSSATVTGRPQWQLISWASWAPPFRGVLELGLRYLTEGQPAAKVEHWGPPAQRGQ